MDAADQWEMPARHHSGNQSGIERVGKLLPTGVAWRTCGNGPVGADAPAVDPAQKEQRERKRPRPRPHQMAQPLLRQARAPQSGGRPGSGLDEPPKRRSKMLTGEPDAGNLPVRFGGRGGANQCAIPTPYQRSAPGAAWFCGVPVHHGGTTGPRAGTLDCWDCQDCCTPDKSSAWRMRQTAPTWQLPCPSEIKSINSAVRPSKPAVPWPSFLLHRKTAS